MAENDLRAVIDGLKARLDNQAARIDTLEAALQSLQQPTKSSTNDDQQLVASNSEASGSEQELEPDTDNHDLDTISSPAEQTHPVIEIYVQVYHENRYRGKIYQLEMTLDTPRQQKPSDSSQGAPLRLEKKLSGKIRIKIMKSSIFFDKFDRLLSSIVDDGVKRKSEFIKLSDPSAIIKFKLVVDDLNATNDEKTIEKLAKLNLADEEVDDLKKECKEVQNLFEDNLQLSQMLKEFNNIFETQRVTFFWIPAIFTVGNFALLRDSGNKMQACVVTRVENSPKYEKHAYIDIHYQYVDFDGNSCVYKKGNTKIFRFSGLCYLKELGIRPFQSEIPEDQQLRNDLIARGKLWYKCLHNYTSDTTATKNTYNVSVPCVRQFVGFGVPVTSDGLSSNAYGAQGFRKIKSRVIIDPRQYFCREIEISEMRDVPFSQRDKSALAKATPTTERSEFFDPCNEKHASKHDDDFFCCPTEIFAYSMSDNQWYMLPNDSNSLKEAKWDDQALKKYVLEDELKAPVRILSDIVSAHSTRSRLLFKDTTPVNNFAGKGSGIIILLYGPPGTGKTMLAECFSEVNNKPLYRLDIGPLALSDAWESELEEIFDQVYHWDAILLIDEAEVIMAERTLENMDQSALAAAFLRKIEYFEGVIFLTTNQIHSIDSAFESRITFGIEFKGVTAMAATSLKAHEDYATKVWQTSLRNIASGPYGKYEQDVNNWIQGVVGGKMESFLNARQIRNVVSVATLLYEKRYAKNWDSLALPQRRNSPALPTPIRTFSNRMFQLTKDKQKKKQIEKEKDKIGNSEAEGHNQKPFSNLTKSSNPFVRCLQGSMESAKQFSDVINKEKKTKENEILQDWM